MKKVILIALTLGLLIGGIFLFNYFTLRQPVQKSLQTDGRNTGVDINLNYKNYINTNVLVFNLTEISEDNSAADVFRVLLQSASTLQEKDFEYVELAYMGKSKFKLEGSYFQELGQEYEFQNVVYTMRTFPQNLKDMNGQDVYGEWTGGMLGVLTRQMEDFNDFNKKWFLEDFTSKYDK